LKIKELPWLKKTPHYQLMDHVLHAYYNKIGEPLKLQTNSPFGPTDAKVELFDV
jgi:hypothetical protein